MTVKQIKESIKDWPDNEEVFISDGSSNLGNLVKTSETRILTNSFNIVPFYCICISETILKEKLGAKN